MLLNGRVENRMETRALKHLHSSEEAAGRRSPDNIRLGDGLDHVDVYTSESGMLSAMVVTHGEVEIAILGQVLLECELGRLNVWTLRRPSI